MSIDQARKSPAATGLDRHTQSNFQRNATAPCDPLQLLLSRLEGVRQYGRGYRCNCPVGHRTRGTLSVTGGDDGRVLLTCFAGCTATDVVAAAGLSLGDLFPRRYDASPGARREIRQWAAQAKWAAALKVLALESDVVYIAAVMTRKGETLNDEDHARLGVACGRIQSAKEVLHGH
jgi:hypothetical protein